VTTGGRSCGAVTGLPQPGKEVILGENGAVEPDRDRGRVAGRHRAGGGPRGDCLLVAADRPPRRRQATGTARHSATM
jgi:hypothetical protein